MSKIRLIDGNSVGRAAHAGVKLKSGDIQTQAIFNTVKGSRNWLMSAPEHTPLVLWDGHADWRYELLPAYKSKRNDSPEKLADRAEYKKQLPHIIRALSALGLRQMVSEVDEADDLAGLLVGKTMKKDPTSEIILTTGDEDWVQLIRSGVTWEDHRDHTKRINVSNLFENTGFRTPFAFLEGKCLQGDTSDDIPGVGGIGKAKAPEFLAQFGSVREFWRQVDSGEFVPKYAIHKRLASPEGRMAFGLNLRMMQLIKPRPLQAGKVIQHPSEFNRAEFEEICAEFSFSSILRDMDNFLIPFIRHSNSKGK